jgi:hypothetical protein
VQENEARHAQLRDGAEALVAWMHARRATWSDLDVAVPAASVPGAFDGFSAPAARPPLSPVPWEPVAEEPVAVRKPAKPRVPFKFPTGAIGSLLTPLLQWSARGAAVAVVLVAVAGTALFARPYLGTLAERWTKLTTTPKTGTVVLESVPPGSALVSRPLAVSTGASRRPGD